MTQLIDQPTNIEPRGISCVDLIVTDLPNLFINHGIRSLLDNAVTTKLLMGNSTYLSPYLPLTKCKYGSESKVNEFRSSLRNTDWTAISADLIANEMTNQFTILIMDLMHHFIQNQMIKCDDRDPP